MFVHVLNSDTFHVKLYRFKLKALQNQNQGARSEEDNEELATLPGSLVVINQAILDVTAKLGHPEFQNVTGTSSRCSFIDLFIHFSSESLSFSFFYKARRLACSFASE